MTTILPAARTPWDVIGEKIGTNLSQVLPGAVQQGYQRQLGLNSIDELQKNIAASGGDVNKILPHLMRAYTLNQTLERSGLGQQYLQNVTAGLYPNALGGAAGGTTANQAAPGAQGAPPPNPIGPPPNPMAPTARLEGQPSTAQPGEGKTTPQDVDRIANQYIAEVRPDLINPATQYGAIATFDSEIKQDLSPEEESRTRQQLLEQYKNPAVVNQVVDRIREGIKNRYNEAQAKYGFDKEKRAQIQKKWGDFTAGTGQRLAPHLSKYMPQEGDQLPRTVEVLQNKYNSYAGALPVNLTPEQMHTNAMALLQNDINKLDALHSIPAMPPVRTEKDVKEYLDTNKQVYKDLADMGFTEALREDAFLKKDMGNEEFHSMIWGDQTSKPLLNSIHEVKAPQEYTQINAAQPFPKYNPNYQKQREEYISSVSGRLKRLKPQDDLILARAMVLDNGGTVKDFSDALTRAQREGLKLSEFQRSQLQEVNIPRLPPLWEIFSGFDTTPNAAGLVGNLGWKPFINYVRGKR